MPPVWTIGCDCWRFCHKNIILVYFRNLNEEPLLFGSENSEPDKLMPDPASADYRIDDIDRRVIHALMGNARDTTAREIADEVNVSAATIRNRIKQLCDLDIIRGYHASIDFERADHKQTYLYVCTVPSSELEALSQEARTVSGVVNVRELISGTRNLHLIAVGETTDEFRRIMRSLTEMGITVEEKSLLQNELFEPFGEYGPDESGPNWSPADSLHLASGVDLFEVTVTQDAPLVDLSLADAVDQGILDTDLLVVAIEREGRVLTPRGDTVVRADDVVTLVSNHGEPESILAPFHRPSREEA